MAWVVATLASIVVVFAAVGSVRSAIAESPSAMQLPPVEQDEQVPVIPLAGATSSSDFDASDGPPVTGAALDTEEPVLPEAATETTAAMSPSEPTTIATSTTVAAAPETTSTTQPPAPTVESYELDGGWVSLRSTAEGVFLESASPKSGWTVDVETTGPSQVKLEFKDGSHEIQFSAEFSDGRVKIEIDD